MVTLAAGGVFVAGLSFAADNHDPVETSVAVATVAPDVAKEMNGGGKVTMAEGIEMHPATKVDSQRLIGHGNGAGCVKGYGDPGQCVPVVSPSAQEMGDMPGMNHSWTCAELRTLFPEGVRVKNDSLGLDSNSNGVACDAADS